MLPKQLLRFPMTAVPMPDVEIKGYKGFLASDGVAFSCRLWVNGVEVASVENSGTGGDDRFWWSQDNPGYVQARAAWDNWIKSLGVCEDCTFNWDSSLALEQFLNAMDAVKKLKRACKSKLLFHLKSDKPEDVRQLNRPDSPEGRAWVVNRYKDDVDYYVNDIIR